MNSTTVESTSPAGMPAGMPAPLEFDVCHGYWFDLSFQAVVVGIASLGAVVSAVMAVALLFRSPMPVNCLSPRLLASTCIAATTLCIASLTTPAFQLSGKAPGRVECVVTGSLYLSSVQTMAFYLVCLNVDEYMLVAHSGSPHRKWMRHVFSVLPWLVSWALTIPHSVEYWGCFRPNKFTSHCMMLGPWSTRVVNGIATVLVPVSVTTVVYVVLMCYVLSEKKKSSQPSSETSYLPHLIIESYFMEEVGCLGLRLAYLWWICVGDRMSTLALTCFKGAPSEGCAGLLLPRGPDARKECALRELGEANNTRAWREQLEKGKQRGGEGRGFRDRRRLFTTEPGRSHLVARTGSRGVALSKKAASAERLPKVNIRTLTRELPNRSGDKKGALQQ
ncbi:hypothetical protein HPB51_009055 [Rhipicephalus microplus]|uniref:G-protein coupled receptors family 1 profile domain-containing protein n=1 Tax=Rhipicephalus microplus TaxID=6941 RepID=A0A9J6D9C2_RHIMP|nr:hypothetical protein HPB51_009055 [Rhipicephalus microplus]